MATKNTEQKHVFTSLNVSGVKKFCAVAAIHPPDLHLYNFYWTFINIGAIFIFFCLLL